MKCKHVIHTVGPTWIGSVPPQENVDLLYNAVYNTLAKASELKCQSVSIPAISSGVYGFPKRLCAKVFFRAIKQFVLDEKKKSTLKLVRLTNFDNETTGIF